ncbi:hypothetical protein AGDE_04641 [Angomonas deanei]|uniref:Uncharacterized protein n=1 Tax=Angomonas deanei TaxID=59799 RepID=A0A7G2CGB6_9TRYP|nr:hypothetical protein AGDE_04641 [Angomonas deanei]CAD2217232.1 hypothetical protein, conserved [Angomonas deanei]|eukprot:EPY39287.1 hypothetical protein AGDE_04641 [Angomonas deanei]
MTGLGRLVTSIRLHALHLLDDVVPLEHLAEDDVLAVEPVGGGGADEELRTVGVGTGVGHGEGTRAEVLPRLTGEGLILELVTVDGLATSTVLVGEVTTLAHEVGDDAVEGAAGITEALLASGEGAEVLGGLGASIGEELEGDATGGLTSNGDIEVHLGVGGHGGVVGLVAHL